MEAFAHPCTTDAELIENGTLMNDVKFIGVQSCGITKETDTPFWIESLNWFSATLHYQHEKLTLLIPENFDLYCYIFGCLDVWMSS